MVEKLLSKKRKTKLEMTLADVLLQRKVEIRKLRRRRQRVGLF